MFVTSEMVIKNRIAGINSIDQLIQNLTASAFPDPKLMNAQKNQLHGLLVAQNDSVVNLINSSNIESAVTKLQDIRATMDSSLGGKSSDDVIVDFQVQRSLVQLIDNFANNLKKDLEVFSNPKY
jgi:hypothetical protein